MSVAPPKSATSHIAWGVSTLCQYCYELPIAPGNFSTCAECVFTCARCKQETPYENGVSWDDYCDPCGVKLGSVPF